MKITALLIDDERKALAVLRNKLESLCPNIEIVGETQNPVDGLELIKDIQPQLLFLDIAMPKMSGFDLLAAVEEPTFEIIFVTAFDSHAIEAIRHCAIGYLVKPINNEELIDAVFNAERNIKERTAHKKNQLLLDNLASKDFQQKRIAIPVQEGLELVKTDAIVYCQGIDGYTRVHFNNRKSMLSSYSIGYFAQILANYGYYLVHKSFLINMVHTEKYLNEGYILLTGGHKVPVSRSRRDGFLKSLKK